MIRFLTTYFSPNEVEEGFSLAVQAGMGGARLTHNHTRQYHYVLQSLMLWREILHDMFKLWYLCEEDLLDGSNFYRLTDTGQGLNRVQHAPRIGKAIHRILHSVQSRVDAWVGSSVVHLGDHNVPNALMSVTICPWSFLLAGSLFTQVYRQIQPSLSHFEPNRSLRGEGGRLVPRP
jgi:hypothetical protein